MHELEAKAQERKAEDEAWYRKQELLREAEEQRRKMLVEEEKKLAEQRQRYYNMRNIRGLDLQYPAITFLTMSKGEMATNLYKLKCGKTTWSGGSDFGVGMKRSGLYYCHTQGNTADQRPRRFIVLSQLPAFLWSLQIVNTCGQSIAVCTLRLQAYTVDRL